MRACSNALLHGCQSDRAAHTGRPCPCTDRGRSKRGARGKPSAAAPHPVAQRSLRALHRTPWWIQETFDRTLRPLLYDPERIVRPFVAPGDRVADIGCGPGYFSPTLSELAGPSGELVLVDAQEEMVRRAVEAVRTASLARARLTPVVGGDRDLLLPPGLDFALMSWMLHEVEEPGMFWRALRHAIRPAGKVLVIEPWLHVSRSHFEEELAPAAEMGFARRDIGGVFFSRAAVLTRADGR